MSEATTNPDEYNGWKNRETWALNLWLGNDEGLHRATRLLAKEATERYLETCELYDLLPSASGRAYAAGRTIIEWVDGEMPEWDWDEYSDMRNDVGSLWRIDEAELGAAWIEE